MYRVRPCETVLGLELGNVSKLRDRSQKVYCVRKGHRAILSDYPYHYMEDEPDDRNGNQIGS